MKPLLPLVLSLALCACAEVPFDANGRVIIPETADFSTVASPGPLDRALDELIVKIEPGAEELRAASVVALTALIFCEINDCRPSGRVARVGAGITLNTNSRSRTNRMMSQLGGLERTQLQVADLAKLSKAFTIMATRDLAALEAATTQENVASWVDLYSTRLDRTKKGLLAAFKLRDALRALSKTAHTSIAGRTLRSGIMELVRENDRDITQIQSGIARLDVILAKMQREASG